MSAFMEEPRVLHVDEQEGWRGGEQQMLYLARELARRGYRTGAVVQPEAIAADKLRRAGVETWEISMRGETDLPAAWRIARLARSEGFSILHAHTAHAQTLIQLASHVCGAGCKVVAHRRIEYPVGRGLLGLGRLKYRFGVDAYVAISNRVKQTLMEAGVPEWRIFVVRSVTDPDRFTGVRPEAGLRASFGIPADAFVVGNIAALVGHKDHRALLEACRIVRDHVPEAHVVIVGDGPLRERIISKAKAMHMSDRLVMTGFRWDVPQLIRAFDVFALSSSAEGLCSTLLEVAASGCPIVATDAGGVREAVLPDETGIIVPIRCPNALAHGILRLHADRSLAEQMAARGKKRVLERFTPEILADRTLQLYRRALAGGVRPSNPIGFLAE